MTVPFIFSASNAQVLWGTHVMSNDALERLSDLFWQEKLAARKAGDALSLEAVESLLSQLHDAKLKARQQSQHRSVA